MRYSPLVLLLAFIPSTASAQGRALSVAQRLPLASQASPEIVVARVMSFDRNQDGKVSTDELSERMRTIVARGDTGGDGLYAGDTGRRGGGGTKGRSSGNYSFGDLSGVIGTRIANAIADSPARCGQGAGVTNRRDIRGRGRGRGTRQTARRGRPDADRSAAG
jgi:hypothetical protein